MYFNFKLFIVCCGVGISVLGVSFLQLIPDMAAKQAEAEEMLEKITSKKIATIEYQKEHENYEVYEKEVMIKYNMIQAKIPSKVLSGKFMAEVQHIASQKNVKLISVVPGKAEQSEHGSSQLIDVVVRGTFFALLEFIKGIEQGKLFIHVDSLSLGNIDGQVECRIGLRIYGDS